VGWHSSSLREFLLVYSEPLRIPGELLTSTTDPVEPSHPYQVLSWRQKTMQLFVRGKPVTVSVDRVKPASILNEADCRNTTSKANPATVPPTAPLPATQTTCSGHHVYLTDTTVRVTNTTPT
jgi:hypothetical protein